MQTSFNRLNRIRNLQTQIYQLLPLALQETEQPPHPTITQPQNATDFQVAGEAARVGLLGGLSSYCSLQ